MSAGGCSEGDDLVEIEVVGFGVLTDPGKRAARILNSCRGRSNAGEAVVHHYQREPKRQRRLEGGSALRAGILPPGSAVEVDDDGGGFRSGLLVDIELQILAAGTQIGDVLVFDGES